MQLNAFSLSRNQQAKPKQKQPKFGVDLISREERLRRENPFASEPQDTWEQDTFDLEPDAPLTNNARIEMPVRARIVPAPPIQEMEAFLRRVILDAVERRRQFGALPAATPTQDLEVIPPRQTIPFHFQNDDLRTENPFGLPFIPESLQESDWEVRETSSDSESLLSRTSSTNAFDDEEPNTRRWPCPSPCTIL